MSYTQTEVNGMLDQIGAAVKSDLTRLDRKIENLETAVARGQFSPGHSSTLDGVNAHAAKEHQGKFFSWLRKGSDPDGLRNLEIQANLSTMVDPDGGYLVPISIEKSIEKLSLASVAMRRLARIVTARGEYTKPLSKGGATGGWVGEKETRSETNSPELTLFSPPMNEIFAMPSVTQKLLDMSDFDVEGWLLEEINDVFVTYEGAGFITGDGVGKPHGIIDTARMVANASWVYGKTGFITGGHATLLNNADCLLSLQHALKPVYRQNATWLMNDATLETVRKLKDGNGDYIWRPGLMEGQPDMLLGKPVEIDDNMPDIGANAYPIAFGDFKRAYTIVDHVSGCRCLRDPYSVKGAVQLYVTKRLAGGCSNFEAVKFLKISA